MGISQYIHVGPYLQVSETISTETVDGCETHNRPDGAKFCPTCGRNSSDRMRTVYNSPTSLYWEEYEDRLVKVQSDFFSDRYYCFSNIRSPWKEKDSYERNTPQGGYPLPPHQESLEWFQETFEEDIKRLEDFGGKVELLFGVVVWYA